MRSRTTDRFRRALRKLSVDIQEKAGKAFSLWQADPNHPALRFKQVHPVEPIYSVRIGLGWRALGVKRGDEVIWFWIGSHADYDKLI